MNRVLTSPESLVGTSTSYGLEPSDRVPLIELDLTRPIAESTLADLKHRQCEVSLRSTRFSAEDIPKIYDLQAQLPISHLTLEPNIPEIAPFTLAAVEATCLLVDEFLSTLSLPIYLSNASPDRRGTDLELTETRFMNLLSQRAGCPLSLDLSSLYTNATNRCFNPYDWLDEINLRKVRGVQLSGTQFDDSGQMVNDRHSPVAKAVWDLYRYLCKQIQPRSTVIRWDGRPSSKLHSDVGRAGDILRETAVYHFDLRSMGAPYQNVMEGGAA